MVDKLGQMKIMQMSFMILGVFLFFILVGLFFVGIALKDVRGGAEDLAREEAISSLEVIAGMSEFSYDLGESFVVDEDKLKIMSSGFGNGYEGFWGVSSIEFYKIYPGSDRVIECPAEGCNHFSVYDSGQVDTEKYSSYVSICSRVKEYGTVYDDCSIGKIVVGVELNE